MSVFLSRVVAVSLFLTSLVSAEGMPAGAPPIPGFQENSSKFIDGPPPGVDVVATISELYEQGLSPEKLKSFRSSVCSIDVRPTCSAYGMVLPWKGTGFVCDKKRGIICTNHHVVGQGAVVANYDVTFSNGQKLEARLLYADPWHDFAFLQIVHKDQIPEDTKELSQFGSPVLGESLFMAGNNQVKAFSFQAGRVSSLYENSYFMPEITFGFSMNAVGGSSGSPLVNKDLGVVGLQFGVGGMGSNFGIYASCIQNALVALQKGEIPKRRHIGAMIMPASLQAQINARHFPLELAQKYQKEFPESSFRILEVKGVLPGSPAEGILEVGDLVVSVDGKPVGPSLYLLERLMDEAPQDKVMIGVYRNGQKLEKTIPLYNLHDQVIRQMTLFGGGIFFEADDSMRWQFGLRPHEVMIHFGNVVPGSALALNFGEFLADQIAVLKGVKGLDVLCHKISGWGESDWLSLNFKILTPLYSGWSGISFFNQQRDLPLNIRHVPSQNMPPAQLTWSPQDHRWVLTYLSCPVASSNKGE